MLTLVQFISLFLMISVRDFPHFETPEFEGTPPWKIIEWGSGEDKAEVIPSTSILNGISLTQNQRLITDFPVLVPFFDRINNPRWRFSSTLTWDVYLKKFFYFPQFLRNFEGGNFFNFKRKGSFSSRERQISDCFLNIVDLKSLAKSVFDYSPNDISFLFFKCESNCGFRRRNCAEDDCQSSCLFVSQKSCFDSNCSASNSNVRSQYFKKKESELSLIRDNLKKASGELRTHTVLFYYQTPCCRTVHQVTALVVIKKNEVFETCYLDSSGKQPIALLKNVINSVFGNFPHVVNYYQQSAGRDDIGSFLVLAGARFLVNLYHANLNYSNFPQVKLIDTSNASSYYNTKKNLKDSLIYAAVRSLWKESFLDLYSFGNLFCREREKALVCYKNKGGSTETLDFLAFKENLVRKEKRLQDILWLLWNKQQSISGTDQFPFLFKLEKIFNLFPLDTVNCWEKDLIWLRDSVIPQVFVKLPFYFVNEFLIFDSEKALFPIPKLNFLVDHLFFLLEEITRLHWEKPKRLFSKNFFSTRMLSSGEGPIIAELICNLPVECFLAADERTPEFRCLGGDMGNCITYHSRERPPRKNCPLFIGCSVSCINNPDVSERLLGWLKDVSQLQEKDWKSIPFVYFFFCVTDSCCEAVHQTWALIIHPLADRANYQAFCYNPSGQKVKHFLEPLLWQSTLNVTELWIFDDFQQFSGSLDFSGVLSICGAKKILDSLIIKYSSVKISIKDAEEIKKLLSVLPPSFQDHFHCVEHTTQNSLKNSLVVIGLKRLLDRLVRGFKFYLIFLEKNKDLDRFCVWLENAYNSLKNDFSFDERDIIDRIKEWDREKLSSFFSRFGTLTQNILQVRRTNNISNLKFSNLS